MTYPEPIPTRERCGVCSARSPVPFLVPDEIWEDAVHDYYRHAPHCLSCFIRQADEKLVAWDRQIQFFPVSLRTHLERHAGLPESPPRRRQHEYDDPARCGGGRVRAGGTQAVLYWRHVDHDPPPKDGTKFWGLVGQDAIAMFWHPDFGEFVSSFRRLTAAPGYTIDAEPYGDHSPTVHWPDYWMPMPGLPKSAEDAT